MRTPEERREYRRLSGLLREVCIGYQSELPNGTTSVLLTNPNHKIRIKAYDQVGEDHRNHLKRDNLIGFSARAYGRLRNVTSPDPDGILAII